VLAIAAVAAAEGVYSTPLPVEAFTVVNGLDGPQGSASARRVLYIGNTTGVITRVDSSGTPSQLPTRSAPGGLACGPQGRSSRPRSTRRVLGVSQEGVVRVVTAGLDGPNALVFDSQQNLLVSAFGLNRFPPSPGRDQRHVRGSVPT
jgi:hypothetical protein